jgi:polysaccharide pyruvyl transferase WcaK-like protein
MPAEVIKGVIRECDVLVAARYHSIIAALSVGVPVVALGWHHKYVEVLRLFAQEENLCDIKEIKLDKLIAMFARLWKHRENARFAIRSNLPAVKEGVAAGARRTYALMRERRVC